MDIRFCDRCSESIPDADFDGGRAVTVDGRHMHVNCALSRSLSINGPRSWLTLVLALYAAGVATFLLVAVLGRKEEPKVSKAVEAHVEGASDLLLARVDGDRAAALVGLEKRLDERAAEQAVEIGEQIGGRLETVGTQIKDIDRQAHDRVSGLSDKVRNVEDEIGRLTTMIREVLERAEQEAARQPAPVAPQPAQPATQPATPAQPEPARPMQQPVPAAPDPEREAEVDRWIQRLKDPNENIRFSATLELGRLKHLRAAPPLIEVLKNDRDYYVRLGAATALGDMKACIAVLPLVEALDDKDSLVRTAANDALQAITGHTVEFKTEMSGRERRKVMKDWRAWWKTNEEATRRRLGQ